MNHHGPTVGHLQPFQTKMTNGQEISQGVGGYWHAKNKLLSKPLQNPSA